jgi:fucose permease
MTRRRPGILLTALAFVGFVSLGLPDGVLGVAWPSVRATFGLAISQLGLLLAVSVVGYLLASFNSGTLVARLGVGGLLFASSVVIVVGLLGYAAAPSWAVMVGCGLFAGLGAGAIDAGLNAYAAHHFTPRAVTWLHACYGVGATLGPLTMTAVLARGAPWRAGYVLLAAALSIMAVGFFVTRRWWESPAGSDESARREDATEHAGLVETLARPAVWLGIVLFFVYTGLEVAAGQWSYSLFTTGRGVAPARAGVWVGAYWASLTAGRLLFGAAASYVEPRRIVRLATAVVPLGALLVWLNPTPLLSFIGLASMGFFLAPVFPLLVAQTPARLGARHATRAIGFQVAAATLGAAALPGLAGVLARAYGLEVIGPYLLAAAVALALLHEMTLLRFAKLICKKRSNRAEILLPVF